MLKKKQKLFFIIFSLFLLFFLYNSFIFAKTEIQYPNVGGGVKETPDFPNYVRYLFNFSIIISGIIALGVIIFSGIKILTSPDQPETIGDARTKIIGAFLGIVILLSSYLILTTINPNLSIASLGPLKPISGVYLTDSNGNNHYIAGDSVELGFTATYVTFISSPSELLAVYDASEKKVPNAGPGSGGNFSGNSIYFLWNRPGAYLYPKTNFEGRPFYTVSSISSLPQDYNKKVNSLKFRAEQGVAYGAVLFTQNDFRGQCGFVTITEELPSLSGGGGDNYLHPVGGVDGGISSFALFNYGQKTSGSVTFYDSINCAGNSTKVTISGGVIYNQLFKEMFDGTNIPLQNHILSFEIDGNFGVVLTTENDFVGRCQFFRKPSGTICVPTIVGSYLYDYSTWIFGPKVGTYAIIPLAE